MPEIKLLYRQRVRVTHELLCDPGCDWPTIAASACDVPVSDYAWARVRPSDQDGVMVADVYVRKAVGLLELLHGRERVTLTPDA